MEQPNLRHWFKREFQKLDMSQREFAKKYDVSRTVVSILLSKGAQADKTVGIETCAKLAKIFNTPLIDVLHWGQFTAKPDASTPQERYLLNRFRYLDMRDKETILLFVEALDATANVKTIDVDGRELDAFKRFLTAVTHLEERPWKREMDQTVFDDRIERLQESDRNRTIFGENEET